MRLSRDMLYLLRAFGEFERNSGRGIWWGACNERTKKALMRRGLVASNGWIEEDCLTPQGRAILEEQEGS